MAILGFDIVHKETDHVGIDGTRFRSPTVLIRVNRGGSISRNAFVLGALLVACHIADGFLTFWGVETFGLLHERNWLMQRLLYTHGTIPGLFIAKTIGVVFALTLMFLSHSRRWLRPFLSLSIFMYIAVAIIPWLMIVLRS